jgi:hypothetical protein
MNLAALPSLHQLLKGNSLHMQGAWPHAIEGPGNHLPPFLGGGGSHLKGAPSMGPNTHPGAQAGGLVSLVEETFARGVPGNRVFYFRALEFFFWLGSNKGKRCSGRCLRWAKKSTYDRCIGPNFNESYLTNGEIRGRTF